MPQYPLETYPQQQWSRKVSLTSMYTIPAQDQALPVLQQLDGILHKLLHAKQISEVMGKDAVNGFFGGVFNTVCAKVIKSRYFKSQLVLKISNQVLRQSLMLIPKYLPLTLTVPHFAQILTTVLNMDEFYFKTNTQLEYKPYPYLYFEPDVKQFVSSLKVGDEVDVVRFSLPGDKLDWTEGVVTEVDDGRCTVQYQGDQDKNSIKIQKTTHCLIAERGTMSGGKMAWRRSLKVGDIVDVEDSFGGWYNATVQEIQGTNEDNRKIRVTMKVYNQQGNKIDTGGRFFGFMDYTQTYPWTSPKLQPFCSVAKQFCYDSSKSSSDWVDDYNDDVFPTFGGQTVYALPRKKNLSGFFFAALNEFGMNDGFTYIVDLLQEGPHIQLLAYYLKGISGVAPYLIKGKVKQLVERFKVIVQKQLFSQDEQVVKQWNKQRSQMVFSGMKVLQKRIYSMEKTYQYQNLLKIKLVNKCINSQSLKRKLQGLSQLKQIIKSLTYGSSRNSKIIDWIKAERIFDKIYITNSHVQLIKKSQSFFRYCVNESILTVQDLQRLLKMAQKGDYQTRISLYSLFQEVSHIFKKNHVDFLIDKILQTPLDLILNQDIDLLHELSKLSNYFPMEKVMQFFQGIILNDQNVKQIHTYAAKKYSDIVAKNHQMKNYRKDIIKNLLSKIKTHSIVRVTSVLKQIFQGIGIGEYGRKELSELLVDQNIDQIIIDLVVSSHDLPQPKRSLIITQSLNFLLCLYKISSRFKIYVKTIKRLWIEIGECKQLKKEFFKWSQQVLKCEQGLDHEKDQELQELFGLLFKEENIPVITLDEFQMLKSFFIEINKIHKLISVSNIFKDKQIQKEYKRRTTMSGLKLIDTIYQIIFRAENQLISSKAVDLFIALFSSTDNTKEQITELMAKHYGSLKKLCQSDHLSQNQIKCAHKQLKIIQIIIDDSEKSYEDRINSLLSKKKNKFIKLNMINEVHYLSDALRKMQVTIPINETLADLRKHIAKEVDLSWQQIKISGKYELTDIQNCRTIKELGLTSSQTYFINRRALPSHAQAELIANGQLTPKAARAFTSIFNDFSTQGKMSKDDCARFTAKCLGNSSPRYYADRIDAVYKQYDTDQDDFLSLQNFLAFYRDSAIDRAATVWSNLRSFGVQNDLRLKNQPLQNVDFSYLPRKVLVQNEQIYNILFKLLKYQQIAEQAFNLLERLPISKKVQAEILSIDKDQLDLNAILNINEKLELFYKLNIIEYLSTPDQSNSEDQKEWILRFISEEGYQKLLSILYSFIDGFTSQGPKIQRQIIELLIDLLHSFLLNCFPTDNSLKCLALLSDESDIDDKMQYLVMGRFPKPQKKLAIHQKQIIYDFNSSSKGQICAKTVKFMKILWCQAPLTYLKQTLITKCINMLSFLLVNEDPACLANEIHHFIQKSNSNKQLKNIYGLIMCYCFYSDSYQQKFIKELFKYLTMANIISEHFGILAILVNKFGISEVNQEETKSVLFENIFTSSNQLTIEGCARLLANFHLTQAKPEEVKRLWEISLFDQQKKCTKQQTKQAIYQLILKICEHSPQSTDMVITKVKSKIQQCFSQMKITSCAQVNQRAANGFVGLKNLGSTCYINSMIQQIFCNKTFRYLIMRINDGKPQDLVQYKNKLLDDNILHQFQKIFGYLEHSTRMDYIPFGFSFAYKPFGQPVNVLIQQDVQEFVGMFFDQLENRIKETPLKKVVDTFYGGKVTNLFNCHQCNQTKKVTQNFYSITLEVKNSKSLSQSLNRFVSGELINDYKCDFCSKKADVSKKTRISKYPQILTLHLQRIVFNLDTFVNEKITTKHSFPMDFNIYPYTIDQYQKKQDLTQQQIKDKYTYNLIGIICHIGNAQSGHYISYIKISQNKWLQFNDSLINNFSINNLEEECFGGAASTNFIDDYQWDKSTQTTKSAYILLYEKQGSATIELILKSLEEKQIVLKELSLVELKDKIDRKESKKIQAVQKSEEEESDTNIEDSPVKEKQEFTPDQVITFKEKESQKPDQTEFSVRIEENVSPFITQKLMKEILKDNDIHFFEKIFASPNFTIFFAKLLRLPNSLISQVFLLLKRVTFGFWLKSPHFKDLLNTCLICIEQNHNFINEMVLDNQNIVFLLIQSSDQQIRSRIAHFISKSFAVVLQNDQIQLNSDANELSKKITQFLDKLFALLPTTVSKCWTKFSQYFQFWYQFAKSGQKQHAYMVKKQMIKHFLDYFLDKKSPLGIYANKPNQIGSKYASPNFAMLLKVSIYLITQSLKHPQIYTLSKEDYILIAHFECLQKLISQNYDNPATSLVKQICRNNLHASEKIAIILLRGLNKSTFNSVQPYLDILYEYVLIDDQHQMLRIKWVLGKEALYISAIHKSVVAFSSYTYEERLYTYNSSIQIEQGASLLQPIFQLSKRAENFCMMSMKTALKLCIASDTIFNYVLGLKAPVIYHARYIDFFEDFINRYLQQAKKSYSYHQANPLDKEKLGKEVKQLYQKVKAKEELQIKLKQEQEQLKEKEKPDTQNQSESNTKQQEKKPQEQKKTEAQVKPEESSTAKKKKKDKKLSEFSSEEEEEYVVSVRKSIPTYMPVKFKFIQKSVKDVKGLKIIEHQSQVTLLELKPNGKTNYSLKASSMQKNIDKIVEQAWQTEKIQIVRGFYLQNQSKDLLRVKTNDGSVQVKSADVQWVWADQILDVFPTERVSDWPKWSLYPLQSQIKRD